MARWRAEALKLFPELRSEIAAAPEIMALWIELSMRFQRAYEAEPRDEAFIARVYSFADWCERAPSGPDAGHDPLTAVVVGFYEDIPRNRAAREDMPRWFKYSTVAQNRAAFAYYIGEEEYEKLLAYMAKNQHRYREWRESHQSKGA